jgi:flagellar biosynthetic protein FlhB
MSEDRTQSPTKLRRQQARERGQVAHSPELTGAAGLLAVVLLLSAWGDDLATALLATVVESLAAAPVASADPEAVVAWLRHLALGVARPLGLIIGGFVVAAVAAHQAQVGGLWNPGRLAPDPSRLWASGTGVGLAARGTRGLWSVVKAVVVLAVAAWAIRSGWADFPRLGDLEIGALARATGHALRHLLLMLAGATLVLGLIDYALQERRFEALLRMTPEEFREDQRSMEGDPALRAQRRRIAKTLRGDPGELLAGASLLLTGPGGLALILAGGPPPRRVSVRSAVRGPTGLSLQHAAEAVRLPQVVAPALARRIAQRWAHGLALHDDVLAELAALWPPASVRSQDRRPDAP